MRFQPQKDRESKDYGTRYFAFMDTSGLGRLLGRRGLFGLALAQTRHGLKHGLEVAQGLLASGSLGLQEVTDTLEAVHHPA
jgi:hypothetical protein